MRDTQLPGRSPVHATDAMAATSHPAATLAAIEMMRTGGNAVDAAITAAAVLCVVEPHSTSIGGDCFALYAPGGGEVIAINGSGKAPSAATVEWFQTQGLTSIDFQSPHAVVVPGCIAAWQKLSNDHGQKGLDACLQPAIKFAENGHRDGQIRFAVESRQDLELSGTANDELITNLLFYLLLHDQNPGKRLKAVKLLQNSQPAQETKMVLVSALLTDSNPGIRLKSIRLLSTYEPGKIIQDACMKVLMEDENEAVRLSAIDIMEMAPDVSMIPALQVVSILDDNDFIRDRAQELLRTFSPDETDSRVEAES